MSAKPEHHEAHVPSAVAANKVCPRCMSTTAWREPKHPREAPRCKCGYDEDLAWNAWKVYDETVRESLRTVTSKRDAPSVCCVSSSAVYQPSTLGPPRSLLTEWCEACGATPGEFFQFQGARVLCDTCAGMGRGLARPVFLLGHSLRWFVEWGIVAALAAGSAWWVL